MQKGGKRMIAYLQLLSLKKQTKCQVWWLFSNFIFHLISSCFERKNINMGHDHLLKSGATKLAVYGNLYLIRQACILLQINETSAKVPK